MKVMFYFDTPFLQNEVLNFEYLKKGNPGYGGTLYLSLFLMSALANCSSYSVICYCTTRLLLLDDKIKQVIVSNIQEAIYNFEDSGGGCLIITPKSLEQMSFVQTNNLKIITWAHCSYSKKMVRRLKHYRIYSNVFLSKQARDWYYNTHLYKNSTIIGNFTNMFSSTMTAKEKPLKACYIGSMVGYKHCDSVTNAWPIVLKALPNAQLTIIGSSKLYNKNNVVGNLGVSTQDYEKELLYPLFKNKCIDSVSFLGLCNSQQIADIINDTKVGIVNPIGSTETFCTSAIEFGSKGVPVIGGNFGGLRTTIPKSCGFLVRTRKQLAKKIVYLLNNDDQNVTMGKSYAHFVRGNYSPETFIEKWAVLINDCFNNKEFCCKRTVPNILFTTIINFSDKTYLLINRVCHYIKRMFVLAVFDKHYLEQYHSIKSFEDKK